VISFRTKGKWLDMPGGAQPMWPGSLPLEAVPNLERREFILMGGKEEGSPEGDSHNWVGCCGHYVGVFEKPWLDIPPTLHPLAMRYQELFRLEGPRIVEMQALWDIPQVMMSLERRTGLHLL
jgi:hypothetical protein